MDVIKKITIIFILITITFKSYSQADSNEKDSPLKLMGFQIGITRTDMSGAQIDLEIDDQGASYIEGVGVEVALRFKYEFNQLLYLKSGLGFYQKNGRVEGSRIIYATEGPFNFLQIPILFGFQPINLDNSAFKFGFESGFSLNSLISSNNNLTSGLHPDNEVDKKSIVPSFHLGVNLEVPINNKVTFNANFQHSRDLTYYFNRRYTWYSSQLGRDTSKDYDLWFKSNVVSVGLLFKMDDL